MPGGMICLPILWKPLKHSWHGLLAFFYLSLFSFRLFSTTYKNVTNKHDYNWSLCCMVKLDWCFIIIYTRNQFFFFCLLALLFDRISTTGNLLIFQQLYFLCYNPMVIFITNILYLSSASRKDASLRWKRVT